MIADLADGGNDTDGFVAGNKRKLGDEFSFVDMLRGISKGRRTHESRVNGLITRSGQVSLFSFANILSWGELG